MRILLLNQGMQISLKIFLSNKDRHETSSIKRTYNTTTSNNQDNEDKDNEETRRSKCVRTLKSFGPDFLTYLLENESWTYQEAMLSPEAPL